MTKEERAEKVMLDFSLLPEEKQNYVLGILQALVFASDDQPAVQAAVDTVPQE